MKNIHNNTKHIARYTGYLMFLSVLVFFGVSTSRVYADSTGALTAGAQAAKATGAGDNNGFETTPTNTTVNDNSHAVSASTGSGNATDGCATFNQAEDDAHDFYNFGVSIPASSTVNGIKVDTSSLWDSNSGTNQLCIELSWNGGTSWTASAKTTGDIGTAETAVALGGAADTWGRTWTASELADANFRLRVMIDPGASNVRSASLDYLAVTVTYTPNPPSPNPPSFSTTPTPASTSSVSMTSVTGVTGDTPVSYYFTATTSTCGANVGTGGTDSGWQSGTSYTDTGLQVNRCYGYMVTTRDTNNLAGSTSTASTTYTLAATPTAPTVASVVGTTLVLTNNEGDNPTSNPATSFTIYVSGTSPNDASWEGKYVTSGGAPSATPQWLSDSQLTSLSITGLSGLTSYNFYAVARNQDSINSATSSAAATTTLEVTPPSPNPVYFTTTPTPASTSSVSMTSVTATDASSPVSYYFTATTSTCGADVGTGGTDSGWQSGTSYTDTGLQANKCYGYMVTARDALGNTGATSTASTTYTLAATPTAPTLASVLSTTLVLTNNEGDNPTANPSTSFAVYVSGTSPNDASWEGKYVASGGTPNASPQWLSDAQLTSLTITGLTTETSYTFSTVARNQNSILSATSSGTATTTPNAGTLTIAEHADGQSSNQFQFLNGTDISLFAFNLVPAVESATTTSLTLALSTLYNVTSSNVTNIRLYRDYDNDGDYDAGETAVGGTGVFSATGATGTIIFSDDFLATTSQNYIVVANTSEVGYANMLTISLTTSGITATGVTSLQSTTILGSVSSAEHAKGRAKIPGGIPSAGDGVGDAAPSGTVRGGGGGGGGGRQSAVGDDEGSDGGGETIGNEPGFLAPTASGGVHNEWTNGSNGYTSDASYATSSTGGQRVTYNNFNFGIPSSNSITGIAVKLEARGSTAAGTIDVALSWDNGSSFTSTQSTATLTTSDAVYTLGGQGNTWGRSWTVSEFSNATFHVRLTSQPSSNEVRVDAIQVNVYHQATGGGGGGGDAI